MDHQGQCGTCWNIVEDDADAIQCDMCEFWHHIICEKMDRKVYQFLQKANGSSIHWYCRKCDLTAKKILKNLTELSQKQKELEVKIEDHVNTTNQRFNEYVKKEEMDKKLKELEKKASQTDRKVETVQKKGRTQ